jgi:hypothetical protein
MIGTTAALIGSAAIGAGASILGANKAADAAKSGARRLDKQYAETKAIHEPFIGAGTNALEQYGNAVGLNGADKQQSFYDNFQHDPGFETSLNNALTETMKRYSILGNTGGNLVNALLKTGQNAIYGQYKDRLSQLGGLVDTGRAAAGTLAGAGQASATAQGNLLAQAGQFQGAGIIGAGQAGVNALGQYMNYNLAQQGLAAGQNPWAATTVNRAMI